ncbi:MAG: DUF4450 domain-containing protein [Verrucomicrobiota bacterium]
MIPTAPMLARFLCLAALTAAPLAHAAGPAPQTVAGQERSLAGGFTLANIQRPLRYTPVGTDFVITNGAEFFNRPLYGGSSPFRLDGGDKPEFSLYLPGRGGNLRLGIRVGAEVKWLNDAAHIVTRYRPGSMIHEIQDPLLGRGSLVLTTLALREVEGTIIRVEWTGAVSAPELVWAFGGVNGMKGRRDGDIGCETEPVSKFFQLRPAQCESNVISWTPQGFRVQGRPGTIAGSCSAAARFHLGDAANWHDAATLLHQTNVTTRQPVLVGQTTLRKAAPFYLALQRSTGATNVNETLAVYAEVAAGGTNLPAAKAVANLSPAALAALFEREEKRRQALADRVRVETPDPFVNAAVAALSVAADAVWDDRQEAYLHGGVAWRVRLLGWRVSYAGDELGWHDRTAKHFEGFARQQNVQPAPSELPAPEASANLSRNENALHSNGDLTQSHYDMNLVGVDAFFRHLLWTGDLKYAQRLWPTIERHLAWERRLFRREFGANRLPLYEAYCCIWASDDLAYNGGGATHSSAYNLYHNRMAARVAQLLGKDPRPYEREAELIANGLREHLWLADRGWFAEWKDLLGLQLVHPNAAAWTFYHTVDSEVPTPAEAWQMTRFVDTQLAHFPLRGPGVPAGNFTIPTTSWMPYTWSLNNVVLAETMHTALGYWQANRPDGAFPLFKGALLDSMYLGLCPGNVGMCTWFDSTRRESQRDFGDGVGSLSRAVVEGLFGVQPDLLAGQITSRPGFPSEWDHAGLQHPNFRFDFRRDGLQETYALETHAAAPLAWNLEVPALRDDLARVTVNGRAAAWSVDASAIGLPRVKIHCPAATQHTVVITWKGRAPATTPQVTAQVVRGGEVAASFAADELRRVEDPQGAISALVQTAKGFTAKATGTPGHRTVFAEVRQGAFTWRQPVTFEILADAPVAEAFDWTAPVAGTLEPVALAAHFNDRVSQIFRNEYRHPRSPFCSLATPKQGFGSWCHPQDQFAVDDSGLRRLAGTAGIVTLPNGVPLATPGESAANNIAFVSQWENYPAELAVPLNGKAARAFLLMAGSTTAMQSRFDNGEVIVTYTDGSTARLPLHNPTTWWPIDQDYYIDDFAFARPEPLPVRIDLATGRVRVLDMQTFKGRGKVVPGGAATVLQLPLDASRELKSLTVRALANEVVIGLMSVTLQR